MCSAFSWCSFALVTVLFSWCKDKHFILMLYNVNKKNTQYSGIISQYSGIISQYFRIIFQYFRIILPKVRITIKKPNHWLGFINQCLSFINQCHWFNKLCRSFNFTNRLSTLYQAPHDLLSVTTQQFSQCLTRKKCLFPFVFRSLIRIFAVKFELKEKNYDSKANHWGW